jgi:hypothetical protein
MRPHHIVVALSAWLCIGLAVVKLAGLTGNSLSWWLWLGVPGLLVGCGLAFSFGVALLGLYLGLLAPQSDA